MDNVKKNPILWIIVPCYNEEEVLRITAPLFLEELLHLIAVDKISPESCILFVNDGSKDRTWEIIKELANDNPHIKGVCQSRNRGHQNAVLAGLITAKDICDIAISIDCDGQDDISVMEQMVDSYHEGCDIVYGVRADRESDSWFKRVTAQGYYKFLNKMGVEVVYNHADYRLTSSRVIQSFSDFREVNLFLRGMFPLVGFKSTSVYYKRQKRIAGESRYPIRKMISLAVDGITSLSVKPITLIAELGLIVSFLGFFGIIWAVVMALSGHTVDGWASIVCIVCFLGGIQLLSIGIIGEYVGKTYMETKRRPRFIISEATWSGTDNSEKSE